MLDKDDTQLAWHNGGNGIYSRPSWSSPVYWKTIIHNRIDLAIGWYGVFVGWLHVYCMAEFSF